MVVKPFDNRILDDLCSKEQLDLLDSVDRLRSQGIDHYVSLPQIIVCGDQSSGKSSVLEAISGVSFPVKSNLCTRFPTKLILRKTPHVGVSVSIVPDHSHNETERTSFSNFRETLDGFHALPDLIDSAKKAMAIGSFGRAFSKDLLRIEISGPDRPHLTIVDLPGLIHSETKQQSAADVELVQDVVKSYMKEPRSIILAVVSAKNDYANQIVLKLARAADKTGTRTLGVITKPDTLMQGSASEAMYVSLAQNLDVEFRLGWHVLRNMDSEAGAWSLPKRDGEEKKFFAEGIWCTLPKSILGIAPLRERLSKLLLAQIAAELPSLIDEIEVKSATCRAQLQRLGLPEPALKNSDAENYVRNCYPLGVSRGILDCDKLLIRSLPYQLEHGVPCPFGATLCSDRPDDGFAMDSGTISFQDLGLNSKFAKGLSVQRRSVCAVVPDEPFLGEFYPLEGNATMRSYLYYLTPGMDIQGFFYRNENSSATYKLLALHMPFEPANIIKLLRPESNDHDPSIITLRSNGVQFLSTQDDPWFSVHSRVKFDNSSGVVPEMVIYETDHFLNIIACKEATRFCSSLSNECSPWTGLSPSAAHMSRAISIIAGSHVQSGTSEFEEFSKVITLVALSLQYNSLPHSISDRPASSALQAARYYDGIVQHHLEPEQWKVELEYWFAMAMARLQLEIFNTIEKPPGVDELQAYNQWESNGLNSLCGRIKFRSPDHSTLSTTGIVVVLTLVGLLTLVSLLDMILAWVPAQWAKNLIEEWERLENLQLLEELEAWLNRARDSNDLLEIRHETK